MVLKNTGDKTQHSILNQLSIPFDKNYNEVISRPLRPIHYLGSKLRILDSILDVVNDLDPSGGPVCDLFSGSGSISRHFSHSREVTSVDIQEYSRVICSALLNPTALNSGSYFLESCLNSGHHISLKKALEPMISYENLCIEKSLLGDSELLCDLLEKGSIIGAINNPDLDSPYELKLALKETICRIKELDPRDCQATLYLGGVYFSYSQSVDLDAILAKIFSTDKKYRDTLLAALLSTASDAVNTIGKQFAQPLQPRNRNGDPKNNLGQRCQKDRTINIFKIFQKWLNVYSNLERTSLTHTVLKMDFLDALDIIDKNIKVVYADPPYTRDHYSRFYHGLETLCLRDSPIISTTKIGGTLRCSRGVYRENRHQSPFCIKSKASEAFENMFKKISQHGASLILSYSPFDQSGQARPRVMTIENLTTIASKYFDSVKEVCPGKFSHSKLNHRRKNFNNTVNGEILLVCKNSSL